jgi:hypothetical protein
MNDSEILMFGVGGMSVLGIITYIYLKKITKRYIDGSHPLLDISTPEVRV